MRNLGRVNTNVAEEPCNVTALIDAMSETLKRLNGLAHRIGIEHRSVVQGQLDQLQKGFTHSSAIPEADRAYLRAKHELAAIKRRAELFDNNHLFGDPAWNILIDLYVRQRSGQTTPISSACIASGAAATTALRYINSLVDGGWLSRRLDASDARRVYVDLTPEGVDRLTSLLAKDVPWEYRQPT